MRIFNFVKDERLLNVLNSKYFHLLFFSIIIAFGLLPYFSDGYFLLGGDGDFHLSYERLLRYGYSWVEDGFGLPTYAINTIWSFPVIFSLLEKMGVSIPIIKFLLNFSMYFLGFLSIYLVCKELKTPPFLSFVLSLFYVLNPFCFSYMTRLNMSLTIVPSVMMFIFWVIIKYYFNNFKLFFCFGLLSSFFAFANTNPPQMVILHIVVFMSVNIASYYHNKKYIVNEITKKYFTVVLSFILFNFWWLINLYSFVSSGMVNKMYTETTATSFLNMVVASSNVIILRILSFRTGFTTNPAENYFGYFYNTGPAILISLIPIVVVSYYFLTSRNKSERDRLILGVFFTSLCVLFLTKGNTPPFGFVYNFMFKHLPFFNIFKGPLEKFGMLYLFTFSVLIVFVMNEFAKGGRYYKNVLVMFLIYLIFFSIPIFNGNMVPDSKIGKIPGYTSENDYDTLTYKEKNECKDLRRYIDNEDTDYRILSFPGNRDYYAVTFWMYDNKFYSGVDPLLSNTNKPYILFKDGTRHLYSNIANTNYKNRLGIYNIKKILVNENLVPRYGFAENETTSELKIIFDKFMTSKRWGNFTLYDTQDYFIPRIYAAGISEE